MCSSTFHNNVHNKQPMTAKKKKKYVVARIWDQGRVENDCLMAVGCLRQRQSGTR